MFLEQPSTAEVRPDEVRIRPVLTKHREASRENLADTFYISQPLPKGQPAQGLDGIALQIETEREKNAARKVLLQEAEDLLKVIEKSPRAKGSRGKSSAVNN